jgi:hypothetical protein
MATITKAVDSPKNTSMADLTITMKDGTVVTKSVFKKNIDTLEKTKTYLAYLERVDAAPEPKTLSVSSMSFLKGAKSS